MHFRILILSVSMLTFGGCKPFGGCEDRTIGSSKSESGFLAEWTEVRCGATASNATVVWVKPPGWFAKRESVLVVTGIVPISVRWRTERSLVVSCNAYRIEKQLHLSSGIEIIYEQDKPTVSGG